jgi:hypothetical protein
MRHLWSLLAGVVAAPLTWLFLSTGQHRSQAVVARWDATGVFDTADLIGPALFLLAAGIVLGLLGTLRWSPAGPLVAGILFVIPTILMFINPFNALEAFYRPDDGGSRRLFGQDLQPWLPVENGTLLVIGALLLMAVFSVHRWRRWPTLPAPIPAATDEEVVAGISALGEGQQKPPETMTDDEILAAAAAFEESKPAEEPPAEEPPKEEQPKEEQPTEVQQKAKTGPEEEVR